VRVDRSPAGEELNPDEVTEARQAASLILLRDSAEGPEVLLVKRNPQQRFMGGAWVFPGGAKHSEDDDHPATARRELNEEAGVELPEGAELVPFSRWITPAEVKVRFDTWFFAAEVAVGTQATADGAECVDARWLRPDDALAAHERDELMLVFPTIKHLELLAESSSVEETLAAARARPVTTILPKVVMRDDAAEVLLPGEPGYDEA
jgi:8-oxo-dGTP pyrophosphatase MutT (NUDIX family)